MMAGLPCSISLMFFCGLPAGSGDFLGSAKAWNLFGLFFGFAPLPEAYAAGKLAEVPAWIKNWKAGPTKQPGLKFSKTDL